MKREVDSPKAYLADLESAQRDLVTRIRQAIRKVMPKFREQISCGMLDYPGLANLAAQKHYVSLYVAPRILARHRKNFPGVEAGKSCLRFRKLEQADPQALESLLADVLEYRNETKDA